MKILKLPQELRDLAIKRRIQHYNSFEKIRKPYIEEINFDVSLLGAFPWGETEEGFSFWENINNKYKYVMKVMKVTYVYEGDVYTSEVISYNQTHYKVMCGDIKILVNVNDAISVELDEQSDAISVELK